MSIMVYSYKVAKTLSFFKIYSQVLDNFDGIHHRSIWCAHYIRHAKLTCYI